MMWNSWLRHMIPEMVKRLCSLCVSMQCKFFKLATMHVVSMTKGEVLRDKCDVSEI